MNPVKEENLPEFTAIVRPFRGHVFLKFTAEAMLKSSMKGRFIIANPANPSDLSIEKCEIYSVNDSTPFYNAGDIVLIDYAIFVQGKFKQGNKRAPQETREVFRIEKPNNEFDSVYWCYDGTDNFNETEIFGRFAGDDIHMTPPVYDSIEGYKRPGWLLIEPPPIVKKSLIIHYEEKQDRSKAFYSKVVAAYDGGRFHVGESYWFAPHSSRPIFFDDKEFAIVKDIYVLAKK